LIGLLLGSLAAVLIASSTRWIAIAQIEQLLPFGHGQAIRLLPDPPDVRESARRAVGHSRGYRPHLAAACLGYTGPERVDPLRELTDRFPDNPSLRSSILRFRCMKQVQSTGRAEEAQLNNPGLATSKQGARPTPEAIAAFEEDARIGEELDAD